MRVRIGIILALLLAVACSAAAAVTYDSLLSGPLGTAPVTASAVFDGGTWTYTYVVDISGFWRNTTGMSIGNPYRSLFDASCNDSALTNPVFMNTDSIMWTAGNVGPAAGSIEFSYRSKVGPGIVDAAVWAGALPATGVTLGLVPEPSSLAALGSLSLGVVGFFIRRRARQ